METTSVETLRQALATVDLSTSRAFLDDYAAQADRSALEAFGMEQLSEWHATEGHPWRGLSIAVSWVAENSLGTAGLATAEEVDWLTLMWTSEQGRAELTAQAEAARATCQWTELDPAADPRLACWNYALFTILSAMIEALHSTAQPPSVEGPAEELEDVRVEVAGRVELPAAHDLRWPEEPPTTPEAGETLWPTAVAELAANEPFRALCQEVWRSRAHAKFLTTQVTRQGVDVVPTLGSLALQTALSYLAQGTTLDLPPSETTKKTWGQRLASLFEESAEDDRPKFKPEEVRTAFVSAAAERTGQGLTYADLDTLKEELGHLVRNAEDRLSDPLHRLVVRRVVEALRRCLEDQEKAFEALYEPLAARQRIFQLRQGIDSVPTVPVDEWASRAGLPTVRELIQAFEGGVLGKLGFHLQVPYVLLVEATGQWIRENTTVDQAALTALWLGPHRFDLVERETDLQFRIDNEHAYDHGNTVNVVLLNVLRTLIQGEGPSLPPIDASTYEEWKERTPSSVLSRTFGRLGRGRYEERFEDLTDSARALMLARLGQAEVQRFQELKKLHMGSPESATRLGRHLDALLRGPVDQLRRQALKDNDATALQAAEAWEVVVEAFRTTVHQAEEYLRAAGEPMNGALTK